MDLGHPQSIYTNSGNIQCSTLFYRKVLITGKFYGPSVRDLPTSPGPWGHGTGAAMFQMLVSICFTVHGPIAYLECHEKITLETPIIRDMTRMRGHGSEGLGRPLRRERRNSKTTYSSSTLEVRVGTYHVGSKNRGG